MLTPAATSALLAAPAAWLFCQALKLIVARCAGRHHGKRFGDYGGFPSTHATVAATVATVAGMRAGWADPVAGLAIGWAWLTILDAVGFRQ